MKKKCQQAERRAEFCGVMGNAHRILIIWALKRGELTVSEIAVDIDTSLQNTSQHLRLMKDKGILESRRDGREIYYSLADTKFSQSCPVIQDHK